MDEALLAAFRGAHYLVCLDASEWADIHVDRPLPASLQRLVGTRAWGFITAWNPQSIARPDADNLAAQRELDSALRQLPNTIIRPAIGVGSDWHEPSLFVIGANAADLDTLARHHGQLAYVHGCADGFAVLHLLD